MSYLYNRRDDLIDLLVEEEHQYKITIKDGSSGNTGDYIVVINETDFEDEPKGTAGGSDGPDRTFDSAFVEPDPSGGSDSSSTIASNLQTKISNSDKPVNATVSGDTITLRESEPYLDNHVEVYTTDDGGYINIVKEAAQSYELQHASNWDGSFSKIDSIPRHGGHSGSPGADPAPTGSDRSALRSWVRFRFAPSDYGGVGDETVQFFKTAPVFDGSTQTASPILIIPTREMMFENHPGLMLDGKAPRAADKSSALELRLPYQSTSATIKNKSDPAETIFFSFGSGSSEWELGQGDQFSDNKTGTSSITIRTRNGASNDARVLINVTLNRNEIL